MFSNRKNGTCQRRTLAVGRGLEFVFHEPEIAIDTILLEQYSGHYKRDDEIIYITRLSSNIYINFPGGKVKLYVKTTDIFYARGLGGGGKNQFVKDGKGKVIGYNLILDKTTISYSKID